MTDAPSLEPGYFCSPCHAPAQSLLLGVLASASGLVAVGAEQPPARAIAYASADGRSWTAVGGIHAGDGSTALAAASDGTRTVIAGNDASGAASWAADGDGTWQPSAAGASLARPAGGAAAMTAVLAWAGEFVAVGYRDDPAAGTTSGVAWRSRDGRAWQPDQPDPGLFDGVRLWGLAATGRTLVAVGTRGDPTYGAAVAFRWTSATGWRRAQVEEGGSIHAVASLGQGFVAVGQTSTDDGAAAWTSADGSTWRRVPDQPAFHHGDAPVRMKSVAAFGGGLIAGGWRSDAGNGSGVIWTSMDGVSWQQADWVPAFSGGEIAAVAAWDGLLVGAGRTGYPDNNQATIWTAPAP